MLKLLTREQVITLAPSVVTEVPHYTVSDKYSHVKSIDIIDEMIRLDWHPVVAKQVHTRTESRKGFQKHMVSFVHDRDISKKTSEMFMLLLKNAHDRTSAYCLIGGFWRIICSNGLIIADKVFTEMRLTHTHLDRAMVLNHSRNAIAQSSLVENQVKAMKATILPLKARLDFAEFALLQKYDRHEQMPISPEKALETRRDADIGDDVWRTFNVIQENVIKGGQFQRERVDSFGRGYAASRPIENIDRDLAINKALWMRAVEFSQN